MIDISATKTSPIIPLTQIIIHAFNHCAVWLLSLTRGPHSGTPSLGPLGCQARAELPSIDLACKHTTIIRTGALWKAYVHVVIVHDPQGHLRVLPICPIEHNYLLIQKLWARTNPPTPTAISPPSSLSL